MMSTLYSSRIAYYSCGVGAIELSSNKFIRHDLFDNNITDNVMFCYQSLNHHFGKSTLQLAEKKSGLCGVNSSRLVTRVSQQLSFIL